MKTLLRACLGLFLILVMCGPASAGAATYRSADGSLFTFYGDYTMSVDADWGRFNGVWWWDRYPSDVSASYDGGRVQLVIACKIMWPGPAPTVDEALSGSASPSGERMKVATTVTDGL